MANLTVLKGKFHRFLCFWTYKCRIRIQIRTEINIGSRIHIGINMSPIRIAAISDLMFFQMNNTLSVMKKPMLTPGGPPTVAAGPVLVQGVHPQLLQPQLQPQLQQQQPQQQLEQLPKNIIQTRELLYRLIISQLFYDGYQQVRTPHPLYF
jgi:hypothetical protein